MTAPQNCSKATAIFPGGKRARSWAAQACQAAGFWGRRVHGIANHASASALRLEL